MQIRNNIWTNQINPYNKAIFHFWANDKFPFKPFSYTYKLINTQYSRKLDTSKDKIHFQS